MLESETTTYRLTTLGECYYHWQDYSLRLQSTTQHRSAHYDMIDGKPTTMVIGGYYSFLRVVGLSLRHCLLRGGVKLQAARITLAPLPYI